ncbi:hypothetical protein BB561_001607 [Smittium simulii]|uniref:Ribosomal protein eL8/eL30/eS12/Gadd45 domain-containing protein n=1 Tax=Smittium simulii TaxID=133385 RepID=A0A2T9YU10_9FUNG|nr:hypothetical protein BB561_001607 [Smittium simulii]
MKLRKKSKPKPQKEIDLYSIIEKKLKELNLNPEFSTPFKPKPYCNSHNKKSCLSTPQSQSTLPKKSISISFEYQKPKKNIHAFSETCQKNRFANVHQKPSLPENVSNSSKSKNNILQGKIKNDNTILKYGPQNKADSSAPLRTFRGIQKKQPKRKRVGKIKQKFKLQQLVSRATNKKNCNIIAGSAIPSSNTDQSSLNLLKQISTVQNILCEVNNYHNMLQPKKSNDLSNGNTDNNAISITKSEIANIAHQQAALQSNVKNNTENNERHKFSEDLFNISTDNAKLSAFKQIEDINCFNRTWGEWKNVSNHKVCIQIQKIRSLWIFSNESELSKFQTRAHSSDPIKAKTKKRYYCGAKEILSKIKLGKIKCVIVSINIQPIDYINDIFDENTTKILQICEKLNINVVFSHTRRTLGKLIFSGKKAKSVSCIGLSFIDGADEEYKNTLRCSKIASDSWLSDLTVGINISNEQSKSSKICLPIFSAAWYKNWPEKVFQYIIGYQLCESPWMYIDNNQLARKFSNAINPLQKIYRLKEMLSPLHVASIRGNYKYFSAILNQEYFARFYVDYGFKSFKGENFLHMAAKNGHFALIDLLINLYNKEETNPIGNSTSVLIPSLERNFISLFCQYSTLGINPLLTLITKQVNPMLLEKILNILKYGLNIKSTTDQGQCSDILEGNLNIPKDFNLQKYLYFDLCKPHIYNHYNLTVIDLLSICYKNNEEAYNVIKIIQKFVDLKKILNQSFIIVERFFSSNELLTNNSKKIIDFETEILQMLPPFSWLISLTIKNNYKLLNFLLKNIVSSFSFYNKNKYLKFEASSTDISHFQQQINRIAHQKFGKIAIDFSSGLKNIFSDRTNFEKYFTLDDINSKSSLKLANEKEILAFFAFINFFYSTTKDGKGMLWYACFYGNLSITKLILNTNYFIKLQLVEFLDKISSNTKYGFYFLLFKDLDVLNPHLNIKNIRAILKRDFLIDIKTSGVSDNTKLIPYSVIGDGVKFEKWLTIECNCKKPFRYKHKSISLKLSKKIEYSILGKCSACKSNINMYEKLLEIEKIVQFND